MVEELLINTVLIVSLYLDSFKGHAFIEKTIITLNILSFFMEQNIERRSLQSELTVTFVFKNDCNYVWF